MKAGCHTIYPAWNLILAVGFCIYEIRRVHCFNLQSGFSIDCFHSLKLHLSVFLSYRLMTFFDKRQQLTCAFWIERLHRTMNRNLIISNCTAAIESRDTNFQRGMMFYHFAHGLVRATLRQILWDYWLTHFFSLFMQAFNSKFTQEPLSLCHRTIIQRNEERQLQEFERTRSLSWT